MPSRKIVTARKEGNCSEALTWAHSSRIRPGDRVLVTTYFPGDEARQSFGVKPFTRSRRCAHCTRNWVREFPTRFPADVEIGRRS